MHQKPQISQAKDRNDLAQSVASTRDSDSRGHGFEPRTGCHQPTWLRRRGHGSAIESRACRRDHLSTRRSTLRKRAAWCTKNHEMATNPLRGPSLSSIVRDLIREHAMFCRTTTVCGQGGEARPPATRSVSAAGGAGKP